MFLKAKLSTQGPLKKYGVLKYIGNISGLAVLARHSLGSSHLKRFPALVDSLKGFCQVHPGGVPPLVVVLRGDLEARWLEEICS